MLSVTEFKSMCNGYSLRDRINKTHRVFYDLGDPPFWSDGTIAIFQAMPEKYRDYTFMDEDANEKPGTIEAPKTMREMFMRSVEKATLAAQPIKGGKVYASTNPTHAVVLKADDGAEMWVNARFLRMFYVGLKKKDVITFHVQPNGATRPLVVKKNDSVWGILMPLSNNPNAPQIELEADVIAREEAIALADLQGKPVDVTMGETLPEETPKTPEPQPEKVSEPEETTEEEPEETTAPANGKSTVASVIPFSLAFTIEGTCEISLPEWDLTDDHLTSPKLVGIDGLADVFCMVDTLSEAKVKLTGCAINVYVDLDKTDKAEIKRLFVRYKPAFIGNVAIAPGDKGVTFLGLRGLAYDMLVATHVYMCVSLVSRYLTELKGKDCTSQLPTGKEDASKQFCFDHYRGNLVRYRICPSETVFEIKDMIMAFGKDGEILEM